MSNYNLVSWMRHTVAGWSKSNSLCSWWGWRQPYHWKRGCAVNTGWVTSRRVPAKQISPTLHWVQCIFII